MEAVKNFFVNLYQRFIHLSWVSWTIRYCKNNPVMAAIVGALIVALIATIVIIICVHKHNKTVERRNRPFVSIAKPAPQEETTPAQVEANTVVAQETPAETPVEEPAPVAEIHDEVQEEVAPAVAAAIPELEPQPEPVPVVESKPEPQAKPKARAKSKAASAKTKKEQEIEDALAIGEGLDENAQEAPIDENETDRIARYKGKWVICRVLTDEENSEEMFFFELHASNGEKLLSSEEYTSYQGALRGIQTHKTNILKGNMKISLTKKGTYIFKLLSGKNMLLCMGENYRTKARCEKAMDSTIRFAATAIIDENVQDIVVKIPKENSVIEPLPENCNGKWLIGEGLNAEGGKIYYFELYANNGEKLLASEEYTTYIGAVNGIQTHKKNIELDNFRISLTKRGDYIYKLLNGNGQLLCLGEHYKTKRLCQNAVESVKRFSVTSPILTEKGTNEN